MSTCPELPFIYKRVLQIVKNSKSRHSYLIYYLISLDVQLMWVESLQHSEPHMF